MFYKKAIFSFIYSLLSMIVILVSIVVILDPYMLFHEKWFYKDQVYFNMRVQNYGLINFEDFDGVILGTSMLENTSAYEAHQKLGENFFNLSVRGGSHFERFIILNYALKKKKLKRVIMSMDFKFKVIGNHNQTFFPKLYSAGNLKEKFKFYSYSDPLKCVFLQECNNFIKYNPEFPNAWKDEDVHKRRFGGYKN